MNRFVQVHLLTSYPPSNVNRDDLGRPKTAIVGNAIRLRFSSQSLKRAWRTSELFESALSGHIGTRTKEMGRLIADALTEHGSGEKHAREWARQIAQVFGKLKKGKDDGSPEALEIEQLAHFSPEEQAEIMALAERLASRGSGPEDDELELLRQKMSAADIALFGRMIAANPRFNVEAAAQVAHAITVHKTAVEDDFFTAVDDLNLGEEDLGAGHMGETEYGAGLFYLYICLDRELLRENLDRDEKLANRAVAALIESAATVAPTGKQASFASRARASYVLAESGNQQPRSLSVAFLEPVASEQILEDSIKRLQSTLENMDRSYGPCADRRSEMNAHTGEGSLQEIIACATE
jgi:CRISPR system Cascade subunit CasC